MYLNKLIDDDEFLPLWLIAAICGRFNDKQNLKHKGDKLA